MNTYRWLTQEEADWVRSDGRTKPPQMTRSAFLQMSPRDMSIFARGGMTPDEDVPAPVVLREGELSRKDFDALSQSEQYAAARKFKIVDVD
jgi:hypothetical protein